VTTFGGGVWKTSLTDLPPVDTLRLARSGTDLIVEWAAVSGAAVAGYNAYRSAAAPDVSPSRAKPELDPFRLGTGEPTITVPPYTEPLAASGPLAFFNVRTYGTDGSIAGR